MAALSMMPPSSSYNKHKWRKNFASMLSKTHLSRKYDAATVRAAATEKVVRHRSHPEDPSQGVALVSPATLSSEDLTASQFASLTGMKVRKLSGESDPYDDEDEDAMDGPLTPDSTHHPSIHPNDDNDEDDDDISINYAFTNHTALPVQHQNAMLYQVPMARSLSTQSEQRRRSHLPQIWDSAFWQEQSKNAKPALNPLPLRYYASTSSTSSNRPSSMGSTFSSCSSAHSGTERPIQKPNNVIHKGRFKIVVGQETADDEENDEKPAEPEVLEWRRKRACTT
ncbi:hypothetical protein BCR43DRAFT_491695 [Syncephalastrum racemosum]|uniref:Uncharacterized protein n=1 Tax=Syncephalastrum racemosum TaxID=13706 RepID=A0A1X2HDM7_SYNRA|nr:hypothetical protein BCR43DRAFT_491695 [Syncephalastrum racemosum]